MDPQDDVPERTESEPVTPSSHPSERQSHTPKRWCVYRFYTAAGALLYVGLTCRVADRFGDHRREKDWWPQVARIELDHCANAEQAMSLEAELIRELDPRYNIQHIAASGPPALEEPLEWEPRRATVPAPKLQPTFPEPIIAHGWCLGEVSGEEGLWHVEMLHPTEAAGGAKGVRADTAEEAVTQVLAEWPDVVRCANSTLFQRFHAKQAAWLRAQDEASP